MATTTSKYGFKKSQLSDAADKTANNSNWDLLDTELNSLSTNITTQGERLDEINDTFLSIGNDLNNKIDNEVDKLQPKITFGFDKPTGGYHGDVYIQLIEE